MCMANFSNEILQQGYDLLQVSSQSPLGDWLWFLQAFALRVSTGQFFNKSDVSFWDFFVNCGEFHIGNLCVIYEGSTITMTFRSSLD